MTWAIHSIVYRDLGDEAEAARYFVKGYDSYVRGAFKTWHEGYGVFGGVCVSTRSLNAASFRRLIASVRLGLQDYFHHRRRRLAPVGLCWVRWRAPNP